MVLSPVHQVWPKPSRAGGLTSAMVRGRLPDRGKETQTAVVWSCLTFIRSGQNHLAREVRPVQWLEEDFLTMVKRLRLQWYGHVSRSSSLAKTILRGTGNGGRKQGRQAKKWKDSIREWTGLEFAKSQRAVENRGKKWRKLVAKSSVVLRRPSRLRD